MEITPATHADVPQLCELLTLLFSQEQEFVPDEAAQRAGLKTIITDPRVGQILVLRKDQRILGMVNLLYTISTALGGRVAILEDMVVRPEYRGTGAGSRLIRAALEFARTAGCMRVTLLTDQGNIAAQRFYQRHGFALSSMIPLRQLLVADTKVVARTGDGDS